MYRDPYEVRKDLRVMAIDREDWSAITKGHCGVIIGALNNMLTGDFFRKIVLAWLFDYNGSGENPTEKFIEKSTSTLTNGQWLALADWLKCYKDEVSGEWMTCDPFKEEVLAIARIAVPMFYNINSIVLDELFDLSPTLAEALIMGGEITKVEDDPQDVAFLPSTRFGKFNARKENNRQES